MKGVAITKSDEILNILGCHFQKISENKKIDHINAINQIIIDENCKLKNEINDTQNKNKNKTKQLQNLTKSIQLQTQTQ